MPGYQSYRPTTAVEDSKNKSWQDALQAASMAALAKGADTQTMLGFALGKFLSNYLNRGAENSQREKDRRIFQGQQMSNNIGAMGQQSTADIANQLAHPSESSSTEFKLPPATGLLGGSNNSPYTDSGNWSDRVNVLDIFKPKY